MKCSNLASSRDRRLLAGKIVSPYAISPIVTVEMYKELEFSLFSHSNTAADGVTFITSETTLVSSKITLTA